MGIFDDVVNFCSTVANNAGDAAGDAASQAGQATSDAAGEVGAVIVTAISSAGTSVGDWYGANPWFQTTLTIVGTGAALPVQGFGAVTSLIVGVSRDAGSKTVAAVSSTLGDQAAAVAGDIVTAVVGGALIIAAAPVLAPLITFPIAGAVVGVATTVVENLPFILTAIGNCFGNQASGTSGSDTSSDPTAATNAQQAFIVAGNVIAASRRGDMIPRGSSSRTVTSGRGSKPAGASKALGPALDNLRSIARDVETQLAEILRHLQYIVRLSQDRPRGGTSKPAFDLSKIQPVVPTATLEGTRIASLYSELRRTSTLGQAPQGALGGQTQDAARELELKIQNAAGKLFAAAHRASIGVARLSRVAGAARAAG